MATSCRREGCDNPLPAGCRASRQYCSRACSNAAYRAANPVAAEARRRYNAPRVALVSATRRAAREGRACGACGKALPTEGTSRRKYCDRYCINQASLRGNGFARREACRRRRARMKSTGGPGVTERDWLRLLARHNGRCAYCGSGTQITQDHVVPIARGGWHAIGNILPACHSCNTSKRDDLLIFWRHGVASARLRASATAA